MSTEALLAFLDRRIMLQYKEREPTEKDLECEKAKLVKLLDNREITVQQANRLAEITQTLGRIQAVREGKAW